MASYFFYITSVAISPDGTVALTQPAGSVASSATARRVGVAGTDQAAGVLAAVAITKRQIASADFTAPAASIQVSLISSDAVAKPVGYEWSLPRSVWHFEIGRVR